MPVPVYGIFEGGGVKGIAHAGAIATVRSIYDFQFLAVAGASAGAMVAALIAAEFSDDDLKSAFQELAEPSPNNPQATKLTDLLQGYSWRDYLKGKAQLWKLARSILASDSGLFRLLWKSLILFFKCPSYRVLRQVLLRRGVFSVNGIVTWLDEKIHSKLDPKFPNVRGRMVQFKDLSIPLKIVAAQLNKPGMVRFSRDENPDVPVALAVGASICVPFLFQPVRVELASGEKYECVDGGIISNFPAWIFDRERQESGISIPTLGFRLIEKRQPQAPASLLEHTRSLVSLAVSGDVEIHMREVERLLPIPVDTSEVSSMKLDLQIEEANRLWERGKDDAEGELSKLFPSEEEVEELRQEIEEGLLSKFCNDVWDIICRISQETALSKDEFRANVFLVSGVGKAKISYKFNMDREEHTDRDFEFPLFGGSTGTAFARHVQVVTPLYLAEQEKYRTLTDDYHRILEELNIMNLPRQVQEKAWRRLKTILSTPIFDPEDDRLVLGVLNLDTSYTLDTAPLFDTRVLDCAKQYAAKVARLLNKFRFRHAKISLGRVEA